MDLRNGFAAGAGGRCGAPALLMSCLVASLDARLIGATMAVNDGYEGPVAEFVALRQEIDSTQRFQQQILALQITLSAAVFSFALSRPGLERLLLIVPITSYLLCARFVNQQRDIVRIGRYIRTDLHSRVPGGLHWEHWRVANRRPGPRVFLAWITPLLLTFPGIAVLALGWGVPVTFYEGGTSAFGRAGLIAAWFVGLAATAISCSFVFQSVKGIRIGDTPDADG
jgi:hypothetical protein